VFCSAEVRCGALGDGHFNVLDWNPARGFYRRLRIKTRNEGLTYGAIGEAIRRLAAQNAGNND
jgi:hypothetical protein